MFKIGDKVKVIGNTCAHGSPIGRELTLKIRYGSDAWLVVETSNYYKDNDLELLTKNKTIMENIKDKFVLAFLGEPEKTFRKVGITNGDGFLTPDGQGVFLAWLLKANGDKFKTEVADDMLKSIEADK